jgi:carbonic anhydrase/acetyltransferase-like protein (isoleucine patch superfamily)
VFSHFSVKIASTAVVCSECELKGDITIGARTVVHPKAKILAEGGPIIIGENNLIEEQVEIANRYNIPNCVIPLISCHPFQVAIRSCSHVSRAIKDQYGKHRVKTTVGW